MKCNCVAYGWTYGSCISADPQKVGKQFEELAKTTLHSTSSAAACCAKEAEAGKLILGHFSKRYKSLDQMLQEAQEVFPNTVLANEGAKFEVELKKNIF